MLPDKYLKTIKEILQDEYDEYIASFNENRIHSLKVNTSKISTDDFEKLFKLERVPWTNDGFYYEDESITKSPYYYAGLYYIQEASAMLPAEVLPIEEDDIVLDACAAPGGKSLKLLNKLNNTGLLVSNDVSPSRANALLRNIERFGFSNYYVISKDIIELEEKYKNTFDKILLDAPCSGEGMFRKDKSLINSWLEKDEEYYAPIQKKLLQASLNMLKDGGMLLYSTCTFNTKEDEEVVRYALENNKDVRLVPIKKYNGFKDGIDNIGVKLFPHRIKGEGHFVCLLQKGNIQSKEKKQHKQVKSNIDFINSLNKEFKDGEFLDINENTYFVKPFDVKYIRTLRSGLLLGKNTSHGFEPSQQLALNLKDREYDNILSLDINDIRVDKYLKGETIEIDLKYKGLVLVCIDKYPLGFGKASNGLLKNKIDKGWIKR